MTCGEAIVKLLERYKVDTIFGVPGVHNLELYRSLEVSSIRHILTRHEQGAGFMADGYARASGKPGVCFVISGPGVTNIATPMGQAYSDSIPMLVISSDAPSHTLGKGWGYLHEVTNLSAVTKPFTAFSSAVTSVGEIPGLMAKAFDIFYSERPRPVHLSIPLDILAKQVEDEWSAHSTRQKLKASSADIDKINSLLREAERPLFIIGGGLKDNFAELKALVEVLQAPVITTNGGKGAVSEHHPLSLGASVSREASQTFISQADVILALGTELADTDCFAGHYAFSGKLIRVDIDPAKLSDMFEPELALHADAGSVVRDILKVLQQGIQLEEASEQSVKLVKTKIQAELSDLERQHQTLLKSLQTALPDDTFYTADMTQLAYSAASLLTVTNPKSWFYPAGYGTLGFALPTAIGAKLAAPQRAGATLIGDYGFQYTLQELATAVDHKLPLIIILWNNEGLGEIADSMKRIDMEPVEVKPFNPDFLALAEAYGCVATCPDSKDEFEQAVRDGLQLDRPTFIEVKQGARWLT